MTTLREAGVRPLDLLLFRGTDAVSGAICFVEAKKTGRGDYSHAGVVVSRDVLDLPFLEPGKLYVWESMLSADEGFWKNFTDGVPDAEGDDVRFGVQLRDLELVVPAYEVGGGRVAWSAFKGERPKPAEARPALEALYEEYGHAPYTTEILDVAGVMFPALRGARDVLDAQENRVANFRNRVLKRLDRSKHVADAKHRVFCSEWVAIVYKRLGMVEVPDPRLVAPVHFLTKMDLFAEPVELKPEPEPEPE